MAAANKDERAGFTALPVADGLAGAKSIVSLRCTTTLTRLPWKGASIVDGVDYTGFWAEGQP